MKSLFFAFLATVALPHSLPAQGFIHLGPGESLSYTFSSLDFVQSQALLSQGGGLAFYRLQWPNDTDQILVELFENNVAESPVASRILTGQVGDSLSRSEIWQDLQGAIRITALNAPTDITGLQFSVATGPPDFNFYRSFVAIPEPSSLALSVLGAAVLAWLAPKSGRTKMRQTSPNTSGTSQ